MSIFDEVTQPNFMASPPCAVCGQDGPWLVWGTRACGPCANAWAEAFPLGALNSTLGGQDGPAEVASLTREWARQRREAHVVKPASPRRSA